MILFNSNLLLAVKLFRGRDVVGPKAGWNQSYFMVFGKRTISDRFLAKRQKKNAKKKKKIWISLILRYHGVLIENLKLVELHLDMRSRILLKLFIGILTILLSDIEGSQPRCHEHVKLMIILWFLNCFSQTVNFER